MPIRTYRDLVAFQRAMDLAENVFVMAKNLRRRGQSSLALQLERAATSIVANIAEGFGRESRAAFANFLGIALGSLRETEALTLLAGRTGTSQSVVDELMSQADGVGKALYGLRRVVKAASDHRRPRPSTDS